MPTPPTTATAVTAASVVIPAAVGSALAAEYRAAVEDLGATATIVDGPVTGKAVVALGGPVEGAAAVVTVDPAALGRTLANGLAHCLSSVGVIAGPVLLAGLDDVSARAAAEELTRRGLAPTAPLGVTDDSRQAISDWYAQANGDVVGVVAGNEVATAAAIEVLDANAQAVKVPVVGFGSAKQASKRLADSSQCAAVRPAVRKQARAAVELAAALTQGGDVHVLAPDSVASETGQALAGILVPPVIIRAGESAGEHS